MNYKLTSENENLLWRQYMDSLETMDNKWLKKVDLKMPFPSNTFVNYSEDEFLEKIKTDEEFNNVWGKLKNL